MTILDLQAILAGARVPRLTPYNARTVATRYRTAEAVKPLIEARVLFREDDVLARDCSIQRESIRRLMLRMAKRGQVRTYRVARQTFWVGA